MVYLSVDYEYVEQDLMMATCACPRIKLHSIDTVTFLVALLRNRICKIDLSARKEPRSGITNGARVN